MRLAEVCGAQRKVNQPIAATAERPGKGDEGRGNAMSQDAVPAPEKEPATVSTEALRKA